MEEVYILSAVRTPGGSFGGSLKGFSATDLGAVVIKEAISRAKIRSIEVDHVIMGNGWQSGVGPNPARISTIKAGMENTTPAFTVNLRCASSIKAIELGSSIIKSGEADVVIAGGMESSSNVPFIDTNSRWGKRMGDAEIYDGLYIDGFRCPLAEMMMGDTAELLAERYNISRREQDEFSLESHNKSIKAINEGRFVNQIVPVNVYNSKTKSTDEFRIDEIPRDSTSIEKLGKLSPVFKKDGSVTAGNSSSLCDAASAVVLISESKLRELNLSPLALILGFSHIALDPKYMGLGPVYSIQKVLSKLNMNISDIDLFEINEAFAAQVIACNRELKIKDHLLNVNGGAISLGHPVGATGAKVLTALIHSLIDENKEIGLMSFCIGGGQGESLVIKRE